MVHTITWSREANSENNIDIELEILSITSRLHAGIWIENSDLKYFTIDYTFGTVIQNRGNVLIVKFIEVL